MAQFTFPLRKTSERKKLVWVCLLLVWIWLHVYMRM